MTTPTPLFLTVPEGATQRLDKFLVGQLAPERSRAALQNAIEQGWVQVNGTVATKPHQPVRQGDTVSIYFAPIPCTKQAVAVDFTIIDEQPDFLIINKPAGLLVHEASTRQGEPSLVNGLLHRFAEFSGLDQESIRPGIVHRIDRDTSGLLLVARTTQAHAALTELFKKRAVKKTYLALVQGLAPEQATLDYPIGRHPLEPHKMAVFGSHRRDALTMVKRIAGNEQASVLAVTLITGRTHQVRVHCAAMGHPLVGDSLYGGQTELLTRQALHAWQLSFEYQGKQYAYSCPMPEDMQQVLTKLNLTLPTP